MCARGACINHLWGVGPIKSTCKALSYLFAVALASVSVGGNYIAGRKLYPATCSIVNCDLERMELQLFFDRVPTSLLQ